MKIDIVSAGTSVAFFGVGFAEINEVLTAVSLVISIIAGGIVVYRAYKNRQKKRT